MLNWVEAKKRSMRASNILSICEMMLPPIDIYKLARKMDINVYAEENVDYSSRLNINSNNQLSIYVNHGDNEYKKRFAVAHTIGHVVLHKLPREGDCYIEKHYTLKTEEEIEANNYAMDLLMPMWVLRIIAPIHKYKIDKLCDVYMVSSKVMTIRLWKMEGITKYLWEDV